MSKPNGAIIYRGPSMLDGAPIVVVVTGLVRGSRNAKTDDGLLQTWIIRDDVSPVDAVNSGADVSICGQCPHRGTIANGRNVGRSCYVTVFQAPRSVYETVQRGGYPTWDAATTRAAFAGKGVRLGAYGDPAAVPYAVWASVLADVAFVTGYTHQWRAFPEMAQWCMASCDSAGDYAAATVLGFRSFRVRRSTDAVLPREVICPASKEAGTKTSCSACKACGGNSAKAKAHIVIMAHGAFGKTAAFENRA